MAVLAAAALVLVSIVGCTGGARGPSPDATRNRSKGPVPVLPPPSPTPPVPTGRVAATAADFDRDPCAVATGDELRLALAAPFHVISGNILLTAGRPAAAAGRSSTETDTVGCGFGFLAEDTDSAETYHSVVVRVARWRAGGAALLSGCQAGSKAVPYGRVALGDEACLGRGSVLTVRSGIEYFTIATVLTPTRADRSQEDAELAPLVRTAATLIVPRLPRA
jgi:hypothetical protein